MNSEERFKKLLQEKLSSNEFSFNENNWNNMRDMIDDSRNKKGRKLLLFSLCLICITGTLFLYLFMDEPVKDGLVKENTTIALAEKNDMPRAEQALPVADAPFEKQLSNTSPKTQTVKKTSEAGEQSTEKRIAQVVKTNKPQEEKIITTPETAIINANPIVSTQPVIVEETSAPAQPVVETEIKQDPEPTVAAFPVTPVTIDIKEEVPVTNAEKTSGTENTQSDMPIAKPDVTETLPVANSQIIKTDSAAVNPETKDISLLLEPPMPKHIISIDVGASMLTGWKADDKKDAKGINFIGGISYMNTLNRQLMISTGLYYTSVRNLSAYSHTSSVTRYGLGEVSDVTVITPEKIHYLQVPFKAGMILNSKNMIGAGYTLGYLLTVESKKETYTRGTNYSTTPEVSKAKGYAQGFKTFDSQLSVFYRYMLYHNLFINAEAMFGITDSKKNNFFKTSAFERNMGLKVTISYNIFQK